MRLERGIEDLLLDDLVDRELTLDGREELGADLEAPLRGRLELGHQLPHLGVVVEQHGDRVHGWASGGSLGLGVSPIPTGPGVATPHPYRAIASAIACSFLTPR